MLEILREEVPGELRRVPHHEAVVRRSPRDNRVRSRVVHHLVRLAQERRRQVRVQVRVRARRSRRRPSSPASPAAAAAVHPPSAPLLAHKPHGDRTAPIRSYKKRPKIRDF